ARPYQARFTVSDGECTTELVVDIQVTGVNRAPSLPVHLSPTDGGIVPTTDVVVTIENSVDPDGDAVSYEFEAYFGSFDDSPDLTGTVPEDASGQTSWTIPGVAENTLVSWRVRATDNTGMSGTSMWTDPWVFLVDTTNDGPVAPVLVKPEDGAILVERVVTCSAENTVDPENHAVSLRFEVATDAGFNDIVISSADVPQTDMAPVTAWTAEDQLLDWGQTYYARVIAIDEFGAESEPSNVNQFSLKANTTPTPPDLSPSFGRSCAARVVPAPSEIIVINGDDADGQELTVQVQIFLGDDD